SHCLSGDDSAGYGGALSVEAVQRRVDAREPTARRRSDDAGKCVELEAADGSAGRQRRTRDDSPTGVAAHVTARRVAATDHGGRQLRRLGERLVTLREESRRYEAARRDGESSNGPSISDGRCASASRRDREVALQ